MFGSFDQRRRKEKEAKKSEEGDEKREETEKNLPRNFLFSNYAILKCKHPIKRLYL